MNDLNVIDIVFLKNNDDTQILSLLCKEPNNRLILKAYEIEQNSKELTNSIWKKEINDNQAFLISGNL